MDAIENKVQKLQELSRKQKKLTQIKQDIADILGNADMDEKKKIAEQMSKMEYESMNQARNLQFIVPNIVKELYEHNGPKGEFVIPKKEKPAESITEEIESEIEPEIEPEKKKKIFKINRSKKKEKKQSESKVSKTVIGEDTIEPEVTPAKVKPVIEQIEISEGIVSLNTNQLETLVTDILKNQDMVKKVEKLKIIGHGNEYNIEADIGVKKMFNIDISLTGKLTNTKDGIAASLHEVRANKFENKVKKAMEDNLGSLGKKMKEYFEKKYDKAVEKIQIENGKLNIYFSREEETIPGDDLKKIMEEMNKITDGLKELKDQNQTVEDQLKRVQDERKNIENQLDKKTE